MGRTRWDVAAAVVFLLASGSSHSSQAQPSILGTAGVAVAPQGVDPTSRGGATPKGDPAKGESRRAAPFNEGLVLADSQLALETRPGATRFNFAHLRDLWV